MSYEEYLEQKNKQIAKYRAENSAKSRNGKKCSTCGLYGCVCQMTLPDWEEEQQIKNEHWLERLGRINKKKNKDRKRFFK